MQDRGVEWLLNLNFALPQDASTLIVGGNLRKVRVNSSGGMWLLRISAKQF